jgi:putative peptide zinc metalloprotease protein
MPHEPFLSTSWYRVAGLKPKLPEHAQVLRHCYRGLVWHVLQDQASGQSHRLSPASYVVVAGMDGTRTVDTLWKDAASQFGEETPSQDELIRFLSQLHAADLLQIDTPPDSLELLSRAAKTERSRLLRNFLNPLAVKIPAWNPDGFLLRTLPAVGWLFSWSGMLLFLLIVIPALPLAAQHWAELSDNASDRILAAENLFLMALCYPVIKGLHELGHGYAVKAFGGAVPEMGVMLLVLLPVPYVDASAASAFRSKWRRIVVGAAGMLVELSLAALALDVWLLVEPGIVRAIAFNVMLVAGISTVLFNGNPLLRYDGYYILSDVLEIPNLSQRATRSWGYLVDRYVFRTEGVKPVATTVGEQFWLILYAPVSFMYRLLVMTGIAMFVASKYLAVGVAMATLSIVAGFLFPVAKALWYVIAGPRLHRNRFRAVGLTLGGVAAAGIALLWIPAPLYTISEGVVWIPETAIVRAGVDGFVVRLLVEPGTVVDVGEALVESEEPTLDAQIKSSIGRVAELEAQFASERFTDQVQAEITSTELGLARAELEHESTRVERLIARSRARGVFAVPTPQDLEGRFVREGQTIGYVLPAGSRIIRAAIQQDNIDLVRNQLRGAAVRLSERVEDSLPVRLVREVPAGGEQLPSKALGGSGGGAVAVDPRDPNGTKSLQRVFQVDLELPEDVAPAVSFGSRVYVRFDHIWEPIGRQFWRRLRQLLLSRLNT